MTLPFERKTFFNGFAYNPKILLAIQMIMQKYKGEFPINFKPKYQNLKSIYI